MKASEKPYFPAVLTIAGSDSGGGAGIQADLRTFYAFETFGCSAISAVTSQNPNEVTRIDLLEPAAVKAQIETVRSAIRLGAAKTGMLGSAAIIEAAAEALHGFDAPLVVDPVMISTSGAELLAPDAAGTLISTLLPLAAWITPNLPEAEKLSGMRIETYQDMIRAARFCSESWGCGCILKGGHFRGGDSAVDIICRGDEIYRVSTPLLALDGNTAHGTGCTLSAAFAAGLALEYSYLEAFRQAKAFVYGALAEAVLIGDGLRAMYPPRQSWADCICIDPVTQG
jgi:hydroxymethylpyrimidine/phosphomethylpyrimidine kinase